MIDSSSGHDLVEQIAGEFLERRRRGEKATIAEYCAKYPDQAEEIRSVLGTIELVENLNPASGDAGGANLGPQPALEEIGDYRIIAEIGRGGMGVVYDAEQKSLGRRVALKVLPRHSHLSESARNRFIREARAAASMHHTNIVPVFEVGEEGDCFFYAMQLIQGQGLDCVVNELKELKTADNETKGNQTAAGESDSANTPSPPSGSSLARTATLLDTSNGSRGGSRLDHFHRSVAQISLQVAQALAYAHARGVIHRDIKPSNLLLDTNGIVWVTDFGLAKTDEEGLTQTGDFLGTLRYMSPERFSGKCDARSDVYALGLTIYELLVQRAAFESSDRLELIDSISKTNPPTPRSLDRQIPHDLETIVLKAIEKEPESRYASAKELAADLQRFINDVPIRARRASIPERLFRWSRRNKRLSATLLGVAMLLTLLAVVSTFGWYRQAALTDQKQTLANEKQREADRANKEEQRAHKAEQKALAARDLAEQRRLAMRRNLYTAQMHSAGHEAMRPEGVSQVLRLTEVWFPTAGEEDLRGWEWYYLRSLCHTAELTLPGHGLFLTAARWSPDGTRLACIRNDTGAVLVWDANSGRLLLETLVEFMGRSVWPAGRLGWSPDGKRLACGTKNGDIFVLDAATGDTVLRCVKHEQVVLVTEWSPDGTLLASGDRGGTVELWNANTGELVHTLAGHTGAVRCFSWHPPNQWMASASWDGSTRLWDTAAGKEIHTFEGHLGMVWSVCFSPDGKRLAAAGDDGRVEVWDTETFAELFEIDGHANRIASVHWSPDGKQLATAGADQTVRLWDAVTGRETRILRGHTKHVWSVEWSPDGKRLASCAHDNTVKVWDLSMKDRTRELDTDVSEVYTARWSPDGTRLAGGGNGLMWWRARGEPDPVVLMKPEQGYVEYLAWDPKGTRLAAACTDGTIWVWDTDTAGLLHTIAAPPVWKPSVCWSPDGMQLASGGQGESILIWDAATGVQRRTLTTSGISGTSPVCWSGDGATLVSGGFVGPLSVWDVATGKILRTLKEPREDVANVAWSPDGKKLASATLDHTVELWDLRTGKTQILTGHTSEVRSVCWSPDGRRIASTGDDRTVRIWDAVTGKDVLVLMGKCRYMYGVDWSPDGKRIAACGFGDKVTVWDATVGYQREDAAAAVSPQDSAE